MYQRNLLTPAKLTMVAVLAAFGVGVLSGGWTVYGPTDELVRRVSETAVPGSGTIPPVFYVKGDK
jgi:hypothetical protein